MDLTLFTTIKVPKCKLGPFEYAQRISKQPTRLLFIGTIINYLPYHLDHFPKDLQVDLEGSSILPTLMLLIIIYRVDLFSLLYRSLFNFITM